MIAEGRFCEIPEWTIKDLEEERCAKSKEESLIQRRYFESLNAVAVAACRISDIIIREVFKKVQTVFSDTSMRPSYEKPVKMAFEKEISKNSIYDAMHSLHIIIDSYKYSAIFIKVEKVVKKTLKRFGKRPENNNFAFQVKYIEANVKRGNDWASYDEPDRLWVSFWANVPQ